APRGRAVCPSPRKPDAEAGCRRAAGRAAHGASSHGGTLRPRRPDTAGSGHRGAAGPPPPCPAPRTRPPRRRDRYAPAVRSPRARPLREPDAAGTGRRRAAGPARTGPVPPPPRTPAVRGSPPEAGVLDGGPAVRAARPDPSVRSVRSGPLGAGAPRRRRPGPADDASGTAPTGALGRTPLREGEAPMPSDPAPPERFWRLDALPRQLDAGASRLPPGGTAHPAEERLDVLLVPLSGGGLLDLGDGAEEVRAGTPVWLPHGSPAALTAGPDGLEYLSVHRRRPAPAAHGGAGQGGAPACWLDRVRVLCGRLSAEGGARSCARCGAPVE